MRNRAGPTARSRGRSSRATLSVKRERSGVLASAPRSTRAPLQLRHQRVGNGDAIAGEARARREAAVAGETDAGLDEHRAEQRLDPVGEAGAGERRRVEDEEELPDMRRRARRLEERARLEPVIRAG